MLTHLKLCLAIVTHNFKLVNIAYICKLLIRTYANLANLMLFLL